MTVTDPAPPPLPIAGGARTIGPFRATAELAVGRRTTALLASHEGELKVLRVLREGFDPEAFEAEVRGGRELDGAERLDVVRFAGGIAAVGTAVPGESLATILARALDDHRPLELEIALAIAVGIAARLAKSGEKKFHGDLVPHHVIVGYDGSIRLIDPVCSAYRERIQAPDRIGYRSPEHVRGDPVGPASDVFSLGILLFEMTTASRLFALAPHEAETAILEGRLPRPRDLVGDGYPIELQLVLRKLLRPSLAGRFADGASARDALRLVAAPRSDLGKDGLGGWLERTFPERHAAWDAVLGREPAAEPPPRAIFIPQDATEPGLPPPRKDPTATVEDVILAPPRPRATTAPRDPFPRPRDTSELDLALAELEADAAVTKHALSEIESLEPNPRSRRASLVITPTPLVELELPHEEEAAAEDDEDAPLLPLGDMDVEPIEEPLEWESAIPGDLWSGPSAGEPAEPPAPAEHERARGEMAADLLLDRNPRSSQDLPADLTSDLLEDAPSTDRSRRPVSDLLDTADTHDTIDAADVPDDQPEPVFPADANDTIDDARVEDVLPEGFLAQVLDAADAVLADGAPSRQPDPREETVPMPREALRHVREATPVPEREAALRDATPVVPREPKPIPRDDVALVPRKKHFDRSEAPTIVGAQAAITQAAARAEQVPLPRSDTAPLARPPQPPVKPNIPPATTAPAAAKPVLAFSGTTPIQTRVPPAAALWAEAPTLDDGEPNTPPPPARGEKRVHVPQARVPTLVVRDRIVPNTDTTPSSREPPPEPAPEAPIREPMPVAEDSTAGSLVIPIDDAELDRAARRRTLTTRVAIVAAFVVAAVLAYVAIMQLFDDPTPLPAPTRAPPPPPAAVPDPTPPPPPPEPAVTATVAEPEGDADPEPEQPAETATAADVPVRPAVEEPERRAPRLLRKRVFVKVRPKNARITVDGKPIRNESYVEVGNEPREVVITAPGYVEVIHTLAPGSDLPLKVLLKRKGR